LKCCYFANEEEAGNETRTLISAAGLFLVLIVGEGERDALPPKEVLLGMILFALILLP